jgi:hypothetical protein
MDKIVGYYTTGQTWRETSIWNYKRNFKHDSAVSYLEHEIFESVDREMTQILSGTNAGFYAGLRFLFAELTFLAHLYNGKKSYVPKKESYYVAKYMRRFKILHPECGVFYEVFRHGLMHSHHPKWLKKGNNVAGWYISNTAKLSSFGIFVPGFTNDVKSAIKQFITELQTEKTAGRKTRLTHFLYTIIHAGKIMTKKELGNYAKGDFRFVKIT